MSFGTTADITTDNFALSVLIFRAASLHPAQLAGHVQSISTPPPGQRHRQNPRSPSISGTTCFPRGIINDTSSNKHTPAMPLGHKECTDCGKEILAYGGPPHDRPPKANAFRKEVPDGNLNGRHAGWICEACAGFHYEQGNAAWASSGVVVMVLSYYE